MGRGGADGVAHARGLVAHLRFKVLQAACSGTQASRQAGCSLLQPSHQPTVLEAVQVAAALCSGLVLASKHVPGQPCEPDHAAQLWHSAGF